MGVRITRAPTVAIGHQRRMSQFDLLVETMKRLRGPDGCPWDHEQTHESLKPYLLEECYEALEAVDSGDRSRLCGELGDVLLQVVFHAQIAAEDQTFTIDDVCARIREKLEYRHPHVFADTQVSGTEEVLDNWEVLKRREAENVSRRSALDGTPSSLPALKRATDVQKKAARVGFDWPDERGPLAKIREELGELEEARETHDATAIAHELGDLLFAVVNFSRFLRVDAEDALRTACDRFSARFREMEALAEADGGALPGMSLEAMDELWERAKESG